jgi:hypothetical protein
MSESKNLTAAVEGILGSTGLSPAELVVLADGSYPDSIDAAAADVVRPVLDSAAILAIAVRSLEGSAELTRQRPRPRPVPGVEAATADPFAQTLLGDGFTETESVRAFLLTAAGEIDDAFAAGAPPAETLAFLRSRALSVFEVASRVGLDQAERLWEVVGTSGSATKFGFVDAWREIRSVSLRHSRSERRALIAESYLGWVGTQRVAA